MLCLVLLLYCIDNRYIKSVDNNTQLRAWSSHYWFYVDGS